MATSNRNVLAILLWVFGLLGVIGYVDPFGFIVLLIPVLFIIFGSAFTRSHAKEYLNVLITAILIYFIGHILNIVLGWFDVTFQKFEFIAMVYLAILAVLGLLKALDNKKYKAPFAFRLLK